MTETKTTEAPIMVRVNITKQELLALKMVALSENKTSQELFAELLRARLDGQVAA